MKKTVLILTLLSISLLTACNNTWTGFYYSEIDEAQTKTFKTEEECDAWGKEKLAESKQEDAFECKTNSTL